MATIYDALTDKQIVDYVQNVLATKEPEEWTSLDWDLYIIYARDLGFGTLLSSFT